MCVLFPLCSARISVSRWTNWIMLSDIINENGFWIGTLENFTSFFFDCFWKFLETLFWILFFLGKLLLNWTEKYFLNGDLWIKYVKSFCKKAGFFPLKIAHFTFNVLIFFSWTQEFNSWFKSMCVCVCFFGKIVPKIKTQNRIWSIQGPD